VRIAARVLLNLWRLLVAPLWLAQRVFSRPRAPWLRLEVQPRLVELPAPLDGLARWLPWLAGHRPTSLEVLRRFARHVARDAAVRGVLVQLPPLTAGWAAAAGLREVLLTLRAAGKQVVVYLPQGGGHKELFVATAAERIVLPPQATLTLLGLAAEVQYFKALLDELGVTVEVHARAEFKTAAEPFARESMSDAQREQTTALLATLDGQLRAALAARPRIGEAGVAALFERAMFTGQSAVDVGLADALAYEDELLDVLREGSAKPPRLGSAGPYFRWKEARLFRRVRPRPYVAVVEVHGAIGLGVDAGPFGPRGAALEPLVASLRAARSDPRAVGVLLHVDSPGGSALVSDLVHREVVRLAEKKPVVACFANVAASGGYYVAAAAHAIVAQPVTITGSIGVISAKVAAAGLLEKLRVRTETIRMAPHGDMFSPTRALDADEHELLDRETEQFYRGFVGVVAAGRRRDVAEIEPLARGRVWSGQDAHAHGLVDRLGGFDVALEELRSRLPERLRAIVEPAVVRARGPLPPPEPPSASRAALGALRSVPLLAELAQTLAPEALELAALACTGDRVLCYAPGLPVVR
jgi:protease-4